jgi:hypothetical protein
MAQSKITLTFTREEFFLLTESLRAAYTALATHPQATSEHKEIADNIVELAERMLEQARTEHKDW